jgi:prepilin-type N-terminal cleavage/methylation domain-containing protein/prepilin-type processing-associated H-X9-DG protein
MKSIRDIKGAAGGFTLVELLVVVCIIAVLGAILFPVMVKTKQSAQVSECLSNMRQMGVGLHVYIDDYSGRFPAAVPYGSPDSWQAKDRKTIQELLSPYVQDGLVSEIVNGKRVYVHVGVFACPSDVGPIGVNEEDRGVRPGMPVWKSTGCSYQYFASVQEDWNQRDVAVPWTAISPLVASPQGTRRIGVSLTDIPFPTRKAVLGDMFYWHLGDRTPDNCLAYCNTLFADGHASRVRGASHLEARLERMKPWHSGTEIPFEK